MGEYQSALAYANKYLTKDDIEKIQTYLSGVARNKRGGVQDAGSSDAFYQGVNFGTFDEETFRAIQEYQRANGTLADGKWGAATNSFNRVLAQSGPKAKDNSIQGVHTGNYEAQPARPKYQSRQDLWNDINALNEKVYGNGGIAWLFGDDEDAKKWRSFLESTEQGKQQMEQYWDYATPEEKSAINIKNLPERMQHLAMRNKIHEGQNAFIDGAGKIIGTTALATSAIINPVTTAAALAGGYFGGKAGEWIAGDAVSSYTPRSDFGFDASGIQPVSDVTRVYGQLLGAAAGGAGANFLKGKVHMPTKATFKNFGTKVGNTFKNVGSQVKTTAQKIGATAKEFIPNMPSRAELSQAYSGTIQRNTLGNQAKNYYSYRSQPRNIKGQLSTTKPVPKELTVQNGRYALRNGELGTPEAGQFIANTGFRPELLSKPMEYFNGNGFYSNVIVPGYKIGGILKWKR